MSDRKAPASDAPPCPICAKPAQAGFAPFCSARCADVDLGRWLTDRYAIPTPIDEDEDGEPPASASGGNRIGNSSSKNDRTS